jgi:hypothetical protein
MTSARTARSREEHRTILSDEFDRIWAGLIRKSGRDDWVLVFWYVIADIVPFIGWNVHRDSTHVSRSDRVPHITIYAFEPPKRGRITRTYAIHLERRSRKIRGWKVLPHERQVVVKISSLRSFYRRG